MKLEILVGADPYNCPTEKDFWGLSAEQVIRECAMHAIKTVKHGRFVLRLDPVRWQLAFQGLDHRNPRDFFFEYVDDVGIFSICSGGHRIQCVPVVGQDPRLVIAAMKSGQP